MLGHYKVPYLVQIFLLNAGVYSKDLQFNNLGTNDNFLKHNICHINLDEKISFKIMDDQFRSIVSDDSFVSREER